MTKIQWTLIRTHFIAEKMIKLLFYQYFSDVMKQFRRKFSFFKVIFMYSHIFLQHFEQFCEPWKLFKVSENCNSFSRYFAHFHHILSNCFKFTKFYWYLIKFKHDIIEQFCKVLSMFKWFLPIFIEIQHFLEYFKQLEAQKYRFFNARPLSEFWKVVRGEGR